MAVKSERICALCSSNGYVKLAMSEIGYFMFQIQFRRLFAARHARVHRGHAATLPT